MSRKGCGILLIIAGVFLLIIWAATHLLPPKPDVNYVFANTDGLWTAYEGEAITTEPGWVYIIEAAPNFSIRQQGGNWQQVPTCTVLVVKNLVLDFVSNYGWSGYQRFRIPSDGQIDTTKLQMLIDWNIEQEKNQWYHCSDVQVMYLPS